MTSPTIIRSPGAIDEASDAFNHAFTLYRQTAMARQQLDLERQKANAQIGLQGAQADEAKVRAKELQSEIDRADNQMLGQRAAMQLHQLDDNSFDAALQQMKIDPDALYWAHETRLGMKQQEAATQRDVAQGQVATLQSQELQRQSAVAQGVRNALAKYEGSNLMTNSTTQAKALSDVFTIDPQQALNMAETFNKISGTHHVTALDDGSILTSDDKGNWHVTAHAWGGKQTGGTTAQLAVSDRLAAARGALFALQHLQSLYGIDKQAVTDPVAATSAEEARGAIGQFLAGGSGQVTAQALRSSHQKLAKMYGDQFSVNYFKFARGGNQPRNQKFVEDFRHGYLPLGPFDPAVGTAAFQSRNLLIGQLQDFIKSYDPNKPFDTTNFPGVSESLNADGAVSQSGAPYGTSNFAATPWNPNR